MRRTAKTRTLEECVSLGKWRRTQFREPVRPVATSRGERTRSPPEASTRERSQQMIHGHEMAVWDNPISYANSESIERAYLVPVPPSTRTSATELRSPSTPPSSGRISSRGSGPPCTSPSASGAASPTGSPTSPTAPSHGPSTPRGSSTRINHRERRFVLDMKVVECIGCSGTVGLLLTASATSVTRREVGVCSWASGSGSSRGSRGRRSLFPGLAPISDAAEFVRFRVGRIRNTIKVWIESVHIDRWQKGVDRRWWPVRLADGQRIIDKTSGKHTL